MSYDSPSSSSTTNSNGGPSFAGPAGEVVTQQIVSFAEDGAVAEAGSKPNIISRVELTPGSDLTSNEISSVLARPILMSTFDWSASTGMLGELARIHLPRDWLSKAMVVQKLTGFRYLRCDFVVEVQINAQPFNAGALVGWFNPLAEQADQPPTSTATLAGVTGYPNVQWRCGEETALKLTIP